MGARRYTKIQTERVLRNIVARRLLSLQEIAVCAYVWAHSWGFNRQDTGPNKVTGAAIGEWCGMHERVARKSVAELLARNILVRHESGALEFNEHTDTWVDIKGPATTDLISPEVTGPNRSAGNGPNRSAGNGPNRSAGNGPNRSGPNRSARTKSVRSPDLIGPPAGPNRSAPYMVLESTLKEPRQREEGETTHFLDVLKMLKSINADAYKKLEPIPAFEAILERESKRLGMDGLKREAEKFTLWLEGQFASGAEKRDKRHRPHKRFADWLARAKPGDNGNDGRDYTGSYPIDYSRFDRAGRRARGDAALRPGIPRAADTVGGAES